MRIFPRNIALGAVAIALGVLAFTAEPGGGPTRVVGPLIDGFDATAVREVRLRAADGTETILRRDDAGDWVVANLHGAPAAGDFIEGVLRKLGGITDLDLLTDEGATEEEVSRAYALGADEALRLTALGSDGDALADVYFARAPGAGAAAFVREADSRRVVRTPAFNSALPADPASWFFRAPLFGETGFEVQRMAFAGEALGGSLEIVAPEPGRYEDAGGEALPGREVEELFRQLRILPDAVAGPAPEDAEVGAPLVVDVTPLTTPPYRIVVLDAGDAEDPTARPATALRSDQGIVHEIDPRRVAAVLELARAIRSAADGE